MIQFKHEPHVCQVKQHLGEMAFLVNQSEQVTGFPSQEVQDALVVTKRDVVPHNVFLQVLLLLKLEDVTHEELLQLLIGKVYAQLLKTV